MRKLFLIILTGAVALISAGCQRETTQSAGSTAAVSFKNSDITGIDYARDFALTDHTGKPRKLADFKGKVVVMFFGYTQCPDFCPTTMHDLSEAMKQLGPKAQDVQVLFVTLDPERDTRDVLAQYVPAFDSHFIGLYGDVPATEKIARDYHVFYEKVKGKQEGSYSLDHTAASFVYDRQGQIRLYVRYGAPIDSWVADLKTLLQ